MPPAVTTHNLRSLHPKRAIRIPLHGAGDGVEVRGPPAAGLEFVRGCVEGGVAAGAGVGALGGVVGVVLAGEGAFGALLAEDTELVFLGDVLVNLLVFLGGWCREANQDSKQPSIHPRRACPDTTCYRSIRLLRSN